MKNEKYDKQINDIYKLSVNNFWDLRPIFLITAFFGFLLLGVTLATSIQIINTFGTSALIASIIINLVLIAPFIIFIFRNKKYGEERSKKFEEKIKKILREGKPSNKPWNEYFKVFYEEIEKDLDKKKDEKDNILKFMKDYCKLLVLPYSAIIIKTFSPKAAGYFMLITFLVGLEISLFIWNDYETLNAFKQIGVKNSYKLGIVKRQLKFAEKIVEK